MCGHSFGYFIDIRLVVTLSSSLILSEANPNQINPSLLKTVLPRERRDAELRYLQNIMAEVAEAPDNDAKAQVLQSHPRYADLNEQYGSVL
jgi:hypothetical protein